MRLNPRKPRAWRAVRVDSDLSVNTGGPISLDLRGEWPKVGIVSTSPFSGYTLCVYVYTEFSK